MDSRYRWGNGPTCHWQADALSPLAVVPESRANQRTTSQLPLAFHAAAVRPFGPTAAEASAPSFSLLLKIEFAPLGFMTRRTKSVAWPPS
jgi:hypothetical protein